MSGCERFSEEGRAGVPGPGAISRSAGGWTCEEPGYEASKTNDKECLISLFFSPSQHVPMLAYMCV